MCVQSVVFTLEFSRWFLLSRCTLFKHCHLFISHLSVGREHPEIRVSCWEIAFRVKISSKVLFSCIAHAFEFYFLNCHLMKINKILCSHQEEHCNGCKCCWVKGFKFHHFFYNTIQAALLPSKYSANLSLKTDINQLMLQLAFSTFLPARQ